MVQNAGLDRGNVEIVLSDNERVINDDNLNNECREKKNKRRSFIKIVAK